MVQFCGKAVTSMKAMTEGGRRVLLVAAKTTPLMIRDAMTGQWQWQWQACWVCGGEGSVADDVSLLYQQYCVPLLVFLQRAGTAVHHSYLFSFSLLLTSLSHMYSFFIFLYFSYNFLCRIIVTLTLSLCRTVPAHTGAHSDDCVCHRLLQWSAVHWRLREDHCIL